MATENLNTSTSLCVLINKETGRYFIGRGWTTQKKYARIYSEEEANQKIANTYAASGILLTKESSTIEE